jgi:hypothetical protein
MDALGGIEERTPTYFWINSSRIESNKQRNKELKIG